MMQCLRLRGLLIALVLLCLAAPAFSLDPSRRVLQYVHDQWSADKGFVGGTIYAIGRSVDGYLWIGTERGLVRFDGYDFTLIQRPINDAPALGPVRALISDSDGNLWIILEGPRIVLYREGHFEDAYARYDLQGIIVTASAYDSQRRVLFAGLGDRTLRYQHGHFETVVDAQQSPGTVISIAGTPDSSLWFGTRENGLLRLSQGHMSRVAPTFRHSQINCLASASDGGLWIGTEDGLYLLQVGAAEALSLPSTRGLRIHTLVIDHDNNLWAGTNHGLLRVISGGEISTDLIDRKQDHIINAIYADADGQLWFGGPQGLERLRSGMMTAFSAADGLPATSGGPIYADPDDRIWFAPASGGLYLVTNGKARQITVAGLQNDVVYSISGRGDEVWVGRENGGLTQLTPEGHSFSARTYSTADGLAQNSAYTVRCARDGAIWAGTVSAGVSRLSNGKFTNYSDADGLPSNAINAIAERADGTIWIATPTGLAAYANGHWRSYTGRDGLPSIAIRTLFEDSTHALWIATSAGLSYLSDGAIRTPPNLPEILREQIFGITEDSLGFLWFTTSDHVARLNRERLMAGSLLDTDIQMFGPEDGLKGNEAVSRDDTLITDPTGRIWISLSSGLSMADPNLTIRNLIAVGVRLDSAYAGGKQLDIHSLIKIPPRSESVTFNYGATSLSTPQRIRFRYKLDGSNQGWSDIVTSRQVILSGLAPGSYRFRILASSSAGLWNGPETSVPFIIEPALWQTWWFRLIVIALLLASLWAAYVFRIRHLTTLLQIRHQERLSEREDIARDLHDTFFQAVQSLFLRLHTASHQLQQESQVRKTIEGVLDDSDRVMTEGREMFLDIPKGEPAELEFGQFIARYCAEFATAYSVEYAVRVDGRSRPLIPLVTAELGKIAREGIFNAFRHSSAKAIEVELTYGRSEFQLRIRDDGCGFEPTVLQSNSGHLHLGLQNMRKRAEKIDAGFRIWSRTGSGTEIEVILPARRAYSTPQR